MSLMLQHVPMACLAFSTQHAMTPCQDALTVWCVGSSPHVCPLRSPTQMAPSVASFYMITSMCSGEVGYGPRVGRGQPQKNRGFRYTTTRHRARLFRPTSVGPRSPQLQGRPHPHHCTRTRTRGKEEDKRARAAPWKKKDDKYRQHRQHPPSRRPCDKQEYIQKATLTLHSQGRSHRAAKKRLLGHLVLDHPVLQLFQLGRLQLALHVRHLAGDGLLGGGVDHLAPDARVLGAPEDEANLALRHRRLLEWQASRAGPRDKRATQGIPKQTQARVRNHLATRCVHQCKQATEKGMAVSSRDHKRGCWPHDPHRARGRPNRPRPQKPPDGDDGVEHRNTACRRLSVESIPNESRPTRLIVMLDARCAARQRYIE